MIVLSGTHPKCPDVLRLLKYACCDHLAIHACNTPLLWEQLGACSLKSGTLAGRLWHPHHKTLNVQMKHLGELGVAEGDVLGAGLQRADDIS